MIAIFAFFVASASGVLNGSPSNFESNDGNMVVDTAGHADWASVTGNAAYDHVSDPAQSNSDDSFTPGQKQDTTCPSVSGHKNSPKDDFTDVATFTETASNADVFLYGATIRVAPNGTASENVELNQGSQGLCPGSEFPVRVDGDKLITIDYTGGGATVTFGLATWIINNSTEGMCFVGSDSAPCWGPPVPLTSNVEGAVSTNDISAGNNPISGVLVPAGQFAEFGINLSATGIIPSGTCKTFNTTDIESRASGSSFASSTKDISLVNKPISNCGEVIIKKHTFPRGVNQNFSFTSNLAGAQLSCTQSTAASFTLNDNGNTTGDSAANTQDCTKVPAGDYTVLEGANPANFVYDHLSCTATSGSSGSQDAATPKQADIHLLADGVVTCVYVNNQQLGAIKITKTSSKGTHPLLGGAMFSISQGGSPISASPVTTGPNGTVCVDHLPFGTYSVQEIAAPTGYLIDDTTAHNVTVSANSTCGDGNEATFAATDTPLSKITVGFHSLAGPGVTSATVQCTGEGAASSLPEGDATHTLGDGLSTLTPGTYMCTVVVDP
jgi:hypothetical protein